jgi:CRISPR-associated protein Cas1
MNRRTPGSQDGKRNSRRKDADAGTMDLFQEKVVAALNASIAAGDKSGTDFQPVGPAGFQPEEAEAAGGPPGGPTAGTAGSQSLAPLSAELSGPGVPLSEIADVIPARMLNEFVYCARLFYYEHVEGVFVESADTVRGAAIHKRVDKGSGAMPQGSAGAPPAPVGAPADGSDGSGVKISGGAPETARGGACAPQDVIHSRSVMLGSERFGVVAKMDLVEATLGGGGVESVCPVDYKAGSPREGEEANELWDTDRMQLGVQCLVLRENGYRCDGGIIYYRGTKQRVPLEYTAELEAWILAKIAAARAVSKGPIPPPLVDSPKCVRCSLAPVCLPDETAMLARRSTDLQSVRPAGFQPAESEQQQAGSPLAAQAASLCSAPRRLMAARDEKRVLFLNTQGYRIGCNDGVIKVKEKDRVVDEVRVSDVSQVALFGNIQISTQTIQLLCEMGVPITFFSMGGWFYGIARGHGLKNVVDRIAQFRHAGDPAACLRFARQFVRGKIHNQRVLFMRNHEQPPERVRLRLGQAREDLEKAGSLGELLGMEGAAAAEYFAEFAGMLRPQEEDEIPGLETNVPEAPWARFDFHGRNRRPPTDPVNALLSLGYSLLAKECTVAAYAVGLDPYVGFYHQPRHGRPALALDVMEEFRPLIAESAVLTAINNRYVTPRDFVTAGRAVNLSPAGRKQFFQCFEQRMSTLITHPVFDYKVSYRRAVELQFRILARVLTGEIPEYVPFLTR